MLSGLARCLAVAATSTPTMLLAPPALVRRRVPLITSPVAFPIHLRGAATRARSPRTMTQMCLDSPEADAADGMRLARLADTLQRVAAEPARLKATSIMSQLLEGVLRETPQELLPLSMSDP